MKHIIAQNIKLILDERGLELNSLAQLSGLSLNTIAGIISQQYMPTISEISSIAQALRVPEYWFFLPSPNFLSSWHLTLEELNEMVANNPSLRGFMVGYMAESKIKSYFSNYPEISDVYKPDDHDRSNKCDLVLTYKGRVFSFEIKSLQTNTVKPSKDGSSLVATFQCDASDRRVISLPNGHSVNTTCLKFGDFDIVAVNLFAFTGNWDYAFALNKDLPHATTGKSKKSAIPEEDLKYLIKSSIKITYPLQKPFVSNPFILMERLLQENRPN